MVVSCVVLLVVVLLVVVDVVGSLSPSSVSSVWSPSISLVLKLETAEFSSLSLAKISSVCLFTVDASLNESVHDHEADRVESITLSGFFEDLVVVVVVALINPTGFPMTKPSRMFTVDRLVVTTTLAVVVVEDVVVEVVEVVVAFTVSSLFLFEAKGLCGFRDDRKSSKSGSLSSDDPALFLLMITPESLS